METNTHHTITALVSEIDEFLAGEPGRTQRQQVAMARYLLREASRVLLAWAALLETGDRPTGLAVAEAPDMGGAADETPPSPA